MARRKVLITGAAGGMGRACARLFGATQELVLTDIAAPSLDRFAEELRGEGFTINGAHAGDLADPALLASLTQDIAGGAPFTLIHTAGLSPALADWKAIMNVNLIGTLKLLNAIEPLLKPGSVAIVIASTAGHMPIQIPEADTLLAAPLEAEFLSQIGAILEPMGEGAAGISYVLSKRGVINVCERKAVEWGKFGARIVTISPGLILTPMGRKELAETPGAAALNDAAPAGRSGTAMDIALAARFLASDEASYITGVDLKVDGGSVAALRKMMGG